MSCGLLLYHWLKWSGVYNLPGQYVQSRFGQRGCESVRSVPCEFIRGHGLHRPECLQLQRQLLWKRPNRHMHCLCEWRYDRCPVIIIYHCRY